MTTEQLHTVWMTVPFDYSLPLCDQCTGEHGLAHKVTPFLIGPQLVTRVVAHTLHNNSTILPSDWLTELLGLFHFENYWGTVQHLFARRDK